MYRMLQLLVRLCLHRMLVWICVRVCVCVFMYEIGANRHCLLRLLQLMDFMQGRNTQPYAN